MSNRFSIHWNLITATGCHHGVFRYALTSMDMCGYIWTWVRIGITLGLLLCYFLQLFVNLQGCFGNCLVLFVDHYGGSLHVFLVLVVWGYFWIHLDKFDKYSLRVWGIQE